MVLSFSIAMFKSRRKRQQQKLAEAEAAAATAEANLIDTSKYTLLDDIHLTHDFRSSVILPQLNKDLDAKKLSTQQQHLEKLRELNESPLSPPVSPPPQDLDGTKQYQELAAWRHQRSQNRYSNGLFGGKQRGRPKHKKSVSRDDINEEKEDTEEEEEEEEEAVKKKEVTTSDLPTMIQEQEFDFSDDEEPMKEMYEPDSDTEENFFFQDFSADNKSTKKKNQTRQRANKAISRFDLSSFARDLHDHRLSVIQPRDSKIIMTEDDELELEKLLERQRQRMSMMTMVTESNESLPPPMPSLEIIKTHQNPTEVIKKEEPVIKEVPIIKQEDNPIIKQEDNPIIKKEDNPIKKVDLVQQDDEVSHVITNTAPLRPSVSSSSSILAPKIDQLKRSVSTTSIKSSAPPIQPRPKAPSIRVPSKMKARKSCSMDNIHVRIDENEPSVTSAALDWITEDSSQNPTSFLYKKAVPVNQPPPSPVQPIKSRGLFGSLRQVSRSKTHSGNGVSSIKGLVRNFSSSHKLDRDPGMSRAAMAVIQHNASKQENTAPEPTVEPRKSRSRTKSDANIISNLISRASSNRRNNTTKIVNMEDASKKRAQVVRRTIIYVKPDSLHDMLKNGGNVPPMPSKSNTRNTVHSESSLSPDDETVRSKEYVTATKVVRQTSVRKRVVEDTAAAEHTSSPLADSTNGLLSRNGSRRRYQLKSVNENEFAKPDLKHTSNSSASTDNSDYLEGVELREMSDGSVVWGLVKKQGNRKSFFAPNKHNEYEKVEEEEEEVIKRQPTISTSSSSVSPPPIPKRSPRRQEPTDVYYSNQMTLPSLLKMMQDQHPGDDDDDKSEEEESYEVKRRAMASVDDQLDEMMRILTSPQQQH